MRLPSNTLGIYRIHGRPKSLKMGEYFINEAWDTYLQFPTRQEIMDYLWLDKKDMPKEIKPKTIKYEYKKSTDIDLMKLMATKLELHPHQYIYKYQKVQYDILSEAIGNMDIDTNTESYDSRVGSLKWMTEREQKEYIFYLAELGQVTNDTWEELVLRRSEGITQDNIAKDDTVKLFTGVVVMCMRNTDIKITSSSDYFKVRDEAYKLLLSLLPSDENNVKRVPFGFRLIYTTMFCIRIQIMKMLTTTLLFELKSTRYAFLNAFYGWNDESIFMNPTDKGSIYSPEAFCIIMTCCFAKNQIANIVLDKLLLTHSEAFVERENYSNLYQYGKKEVTDKFEMLDLVHIALNENKNAYYETMNDDKIEIVKKLRNQELRILPENFTDNESERALEVFCAKLLAPTTNPPQATGAGILIPTNYEELYKPMETLYISQLLSTYKERGKQEPTLPESILTYPGGNDALTFFTTRYRKQQKFFLKCFQPSTDNAIRHARNLKPDETMVKKHASQMTTTSNVYIRCQCEETFRHIADIPDVPEIKNPNEGAPQETDVWKLDDGTALNTKMALLAIATNTEFKPELNLTEHLQGQEYWNANSIKNIQEIVQSSLSRGHRRMTIYTEALGNIILSAARLPITTIPSAQRGVNTQSLHAFSVVREDNLQIIVGTLRFRTYHYNYNAARESNFPKKLTNYYNIMNEELVDTPGTDDKTRTLVVLIIGKYIYVKRIPVDILGQRPTGQRFRKRPNLNIAQITERMVRNIIHSGHFKSLYKKDISQWKTTYATYFLEANTAEVTKITLTDVENNISVNAVQIIYKIGIQTEDAKRYRDTQIEAYKKRLDELIAQQGV